MKSKRSAVAALAAGILGLLMALVSGLALVPRVRLVEVITLVATAIGSGAAFAIAIVQLRTAIVRRDADDTPP